MAKHSLSLQHPKKLKIMLEERRKGASLLWLAKKYKVDHTTIMFHCRKHGITPLVPLIVGRKQGIILPKIDRYAKIPEVELDLIEQALIPLEDGPICKGKTYDEYVEEAMKQSDFRDYFERYGIDPTQFNYYHHSHIMSVYSL